MTASHGIDLAAAPPEIALIHAAVLPVFDRPRGRPEAVGTCVLAKIDGHGFILTAGHVLVDIYQAEGQFTVGLGGKTYAFHQERLATLPDDPDDTGLIPLTPVHVAAMEAVGGAFLDESMMDEGENASGLDHHNLITNVYAVLGFPGSRSRSRIQHAKKHIKAKSFSASVTLAPTSTYPDGLTHETHILLDYDQRGIVQGGHRVIPPGVHGMSGGGVFRFRRGQPKTIKLVGILIEQHKALGILAGTRIATVANFARAIIANRPGAFLYRANSVVNSDDSNRR